MMGTDTFFMDRDRDRRSLSFSDPDPPFVIRSFPIQILACVPDTDPDPDRIADQ